MTGRKRHIVVDTLGLPLVVAVFVLADLRRRFPWLGLIWADGGYTGDKLVRGSYA